MKGRTENYYKMLFFRRAFYRSGRFWMLCFWKLAAFWWTWQDFPIAQSLLFQVRSENFELLSSVAAIGSNVKKSCWTCMATWRMNPLQIENLWKMVTLLAYWPQFPNVLPYDSKLRYIIVKMGCDLHSSLLRKRRSEGRKPFLSPFPRCSHTWSRIKLRLSGT